MAFLLLLRQLVRIDAPEEKRGPWAAFCAILVRIVSGDFRLHGCVVREWSICCGTKRTEMFEITVHGKPDENGNTTGFYLLVRSVYLEQADLLTWESDVPHAPYFCASSSHQLTKLGVGLTQNCVQFVPCS